MMKKIYLILALIGFVLPNFWVFQVSIETGNILLWLNPLLTVKGMFANKISTVFIVDLFLVVFTFFIWSYGEAKQLGIRRLGLFWLATLLLGLSGTFPLFLYYREKRKAV
jgi:hypothetical protein